MLFFMPRLSVPGKGPGWRDYGRMGPLATTFNAGSPQRIVQKITGPA